jgi:transposase
MNYATKSKGKQVLVWLMWVIVCTVSISVLDARVARDNPENQQIPAGIITHDGRDGPLVPWWPKYHLRKWAWKRYSTLRRAYRRAVWVARLGRLVLTGALTMAQVVDWLTRSQLRRHLGSLPVLYALLEVLQVRESINRHCPTAAQVDHGTIAMVLILNRLMAPRPLYQVADWLAQTVLVYTLGVPAAKFNDDRLGRTLDAISQHSREIWQDIVHRALVRADVDLSVIFYDLTAFVVHGEYTGSQHVDFGFAHNTPTDKRKFKTGLNATADGNIPAEYSLWTGRTADMATVQENMERLCRLLKQRGWPVEEVIVIGDRANLNDELAFAYDDKNLRYLAGLQPRKKIHRELLVSCPEKQFCAYPLEKAHSPKGYWGKPCQVVFEHQGQQVTHKGLVVLSGPMRSAVRKGRATQLRALRQELRQVEAKIGQPRYRTVKSVQRRANTVIKKSPVGKFMRAKANADAQGQVRLRCWIDRYCLWKAMQTDGRYLLVTNDWSLSPQQMFDLYRQKDGVEKRFKISKSDLKVSPIYLHKDERIAGMLLINMLALLAYSLLERQVRRNGLQMTTRRIIQKLETLDVIVTWCWDGSCLFRLSPADEEQTALLIVLAHFLNDLRQPRWPHFQLPDGIGPPLSLPPPESCQVLLCP